MKKKGIIGCIIAVCVCAIIIAFGFYVRTNESETVGAVTRKEANALLDEVSQLSVSDVEKIEVIKTPWIDGLGYRLLDQEEYEEILEMVHEGYGKFIRNPEPAGGGSVSYYVTTIDGTRYEFSNNGCNLFINGAAFEKEKDWSIAYDDVIVDLSVPSDFKY